jgi:glycosyltransferase involved in cell wall biosynthesis
MKIVAVISDMGLGGAQRVLSTLLNQWVSIGIEASLLTLERPGAEPAFDLDPRVKLLQLGVMGSSGSLKSAFRNNIVRIKSLRQAFRTQNPDIIVSFMAEVNVLTILAAKGNWPVIVSERSHPAYHMLQKPWGALRTASYYFATSIVVQTDEIAAWFRRRLLRTVVIPNPIDLSCFIRNGAQSTERVVMAAGRLDRYKGFDILIRAFSKIDAPGWQLVIHGDGPERGSLEELIKKEGASNRITLSGHTPNMEEAYRRARVFVHPSFYEGYPNVVLEALALELPVISTASSATRKLLGSGAGILIPTKNVEATRAALSELINDENLRNSLSQKSREAIIQCDASLIAKTWNDLMHDLVGSSKNGGHN